MCIYEVKKLLALSRDDQLHQTGVTTVSTRHWSCCCMKLCQMSAATQYKITLTIHEISTCTLLTCILYMKRL